MWWLSAFFPFAEVGGRCFPTPGWLMVSSGEIQCVGLLPALQQILPLGQWAAEKAGHGEWCEHWRAEKTHWAPVRWLCHLTDEEKQCVSKSEPACGPQSRFLNTPSTELDLKLSPIGKMWELDTNASPSVCMFICKGTDFSRCSINAHPLYFYTELTEPALVITHGSPHLCSHACKRSWEVS